MTSAPAIAFPHRRGHHCGSTALACLLEFHRLGWDDRPMSESDVFGIAGGMAFLYSEREMLGMPAYILGRSESLEQDLCDHVGARAEVLQTDDAALGERWLREEVQAGRPTMACADIKHLDYLDVQMENARHAIVVTEWDDEGAYARVSDFDRDSIERCSLASLAAARASRGFPRPARHTTWRIEFPERLPDARALVSSGIARAVANMHGDGAREEGETLGLAGLERFVADFGEWRRLPADHLRGLLYRIWFCVAKAGTGGALFRSLQADFLEHAAAALGDPGLDAAAAHYRELADAWAAVAEAARASHDAHRRCRLILARVVELERGGVERLERWLGR